MRQQELETNAQNELRKLVRTVDKRITVQIGDGPSPQDPYVTLTLVRGQQQAATELSVEEIRRALDDARDRAILREKIKRTNERMRFPAKPERFFDTRAIRPGSESFANLRTGRR